MIKQWVGSLHELSWDNKPVDPHDIVKVGDTYKVMVIEIDYDEIRLSLRNAIHDPWQIVENKYPLNKPVQGTVTSIMEYGAFVELEPGVTGLVHKSELSPRQIEEVEDAVLIGDCVEVVPVEINLAQRHIRLSIWKRLDILEKEGGKIYNNNEIEEISSIMSEDNKLKLEQFRAKFKEAENENEKEFKEWLSNQLDIAKTHDSDYQKLRDRILLVDNDKSIRETVGFMLNKMGYSVDAIDSARESIEMVNKSDYVSCFNG